MAVDCYETITTITTQYRGARRSKKHHIWRKHKYLIWSQTFSHYRDLSSAFPEIHLQTNLSLVSVSFMKQSFIVEVKVLSEKFWKQMAEFEDFPVNTVKRVNRWNPLIKFWTVLCSLKERKRSVYDSTLGAQKSCFTPEWIPPSFLTFGLCRFQLSWINLGWEQHADLKIAADSRNRCLLYLRATGLFHQFNESFTLSKASSVLQTSIRFRRSCGVSTKA